MPPKLNPEFIRQCMNQRMKEQCEGVMVEATVAKCVRWWVERGDKDGQNEPRSSGPGRPYKQKAATVADPRDRFR